MIKEFEEKLEKDKKSRIDIIKNESLQLLCYPNMKKLDLINRIKILTLELEELELPEKVINEIIEDKFLIPFIIIKK